MLLVVKNLPTNAGDVRDADSMPGSGRYPGGGHGNHPSIFAWRIPWTEKSGGLVHKGGKELDVTEGTEHERGTHLLGSCEYLI